MRTTYLIALSLAACLAALPASAQDEPATLSDIPATDLGPTGMLSFGKTYTYGGGADLQHGFGGDLRYALYPEAGMDGYFGLFGATEYQTGDAWRFAGGVTGGWGFFGLELGVSHRTGTAAFSGSTGLHIGQSFTLGPVSIGGRLTIPLVDEVNENMPAALPVQGFEAALVVRLSYEFRVHGRSRQNSGGCRHGEMNGFGNAGSSHGHGAH